MSSQPGNLEETFLTVAEVAELLKLNQQTVRNWIDQGRLPALRVGRRVRIRRSDLERVLEESSIEVAGAPRAGGPSAEDFWGGEPIGLVEPAIGSPDGAEVSAGT
jgi:excisionase family DNA binding protein